MSQYPELVSRGVERFPDAVSVRCSDGDMTYRELEVRVSQCAINLRAIAPTGRLAMRLAPGPEAIAVIFGAIRAGWSICAVSDRMPDAAVANALERVKPAARVGALPEYDCPELSLDRLFSGEPTPYTALRTGSGQEAGIVFTSGSSGEPKPALLSYGNLFCNAVNANHNIDAGPGTVWLLSLPLYHVGGLGVMFRCALDGGAVAVPDAGEPLAEAITRYDVTHISVVATQLRRLLDSRASLENLRCVLLGGGPVPVDLVERCLDREIPLFTTYGLTEMASQVTTTAPGDDAEKLGTSGKALDPAAIRVSEADEIEVTGDCLFQGYLEDNGLNRPLTPDGWYRTGDLGHFDVTGYLHVTGRRDNQFISGGENIQPEEIEAALRDCDGIERALVVPVPSEEWGQRPVAFVLTNNGALDENTIVAALSDTLPKFKIPDVIFPWPAELDAGLKASRAAFRERAHSLIPNLGEEV